MTQTQSAPDPSALALRAWELCYLDPLMARDIGHTLVTIGGQTLGEGWLHVALAEVRVGDTRLSAAALAHARGAFAQTGNNRGLVFCDEVHAIALRRACNFGQAAQLQAEVDSRTGLPSDAMYRFIAHNSRAITAMTLGDNDAALRHYYIARDAAARTGWVGPRVTALNNLGGHHHTLFNLLDARQLSEAALAEALQHRVRPIIGSAAANLIVIYDASGEAERARAMVEFLHTHADELVPGTLARHGLAMAQGHLAVGEIDAAMVHLDRGAVCGLSVGDGITQWTWLRARCLLARGDPAQARAVAEATLQQRQHDGLKDQAYDLLELYRALADACERLGDTASALRFMRQAHAQYEDMVGRSARARYIALQVQHELADAQRDRELAEEARRTAERAQQAAEEERRRQAALNAALQSQIAETERLHVQLFEQARRDPLTGLHNRRYLFEAAPGLFELARRRSSQLCVTMMDLDHFKRLNDTHGHQAGDVVLQRFSALLTQMLRKSDVICRYGGEEFVAVMPDTDEHSAGIAIARLLEAFQAQESLLDSRPLPKSSFSAGIALFTRHGDTLDKLLLSADRSLYAAKDLGRARIEIAR